jgi:hypothetical protein
MRALKVEIVCNGVSCTPSGVSIAGGRIHAQSSAKVAIRAERFAAGL